MIERKGGEQIDHGPAVAKTTYGDSHRFRRLVKQSTKRILETSERLSPKRANKYLEGVKRRQDG